MVSKVEQPSDGIDQLISESGDYITDVVKENLKLIRHTKGFSLDKLANRCGVSRAMLSQIEQGKSVPTISVLWKIANGLNVPFSELLKEKNQDGIHVLKAENSKVLYSNSKVFASRALFPFLGNRKTEFYELTLKPGGHDVAEPHKTGTTENLVVVSGKLRLRVGEKVVELEPKDSVFFKADVSHEYSNPSDQETLMYLVMDYTDEIG
ncbi:XRE family transcriptional regulator [Leptospira sp. 2 VSF19]|uniref:XRE family transcriptional regulator n=1 Tax=Leptospira soteropolitanensis TaxID=2950025 RepID=A0AAW5VQR5_9LEPT|nr:XRE family transcriptional regulator [Leptospira soteropolitanensis]MCW7494452.1 XRE family transcriptional regulator [Leptospira soteropolitanensis]MCW7502046.1 XRE family transcriptional regulator [Leptospira soteropolitanensis]MCW7524298.1 XRE family transcriptional regulator [Leptospira soteropolitanensis]MCW7528163.1 XRE family transcriptional regulator [Leptospira soteropolitanensis]MCW7532016.1 XRE family transcriptional regulator [Leptospira soteropolitanensis]